MKQGIKKSSLEDSLIDENYEYRDSTSILLRKGWNTILIKATVASFSSNHWQQPVKSNFQQNLTLLLSK